jgi:hypothetical protein
MPRNVGRELNKEWKVGASHALYSRYGTWYHLLERFPGALFDQFGYVLFHSREEFERCPFLSLGEECNVRKGICKIPGYTRMR